MTDLSIIVVNWNTRELLAECLASVEASVSNWEKEVETFVVDNASTDGSPEMVQERFPWVHLVRNDENVGFARANNQGIRRSQGRFLLLLNSDAILEENALKSLVMFVELHPRVAACGPLLLNDDGSFQASYNHYPTLAAHTINLIGLSRRIYGPNFPSVGPDDSVRPSTSVDWVGGACMLVRTEAIREVGLLDDQFFMYGEEMDWCYRMKQTGWLIGYCPTARIIHLGGGSSGNAGAWILARKWKSLLYFERKRAGYLQAKLLRWFIFLAGLLRAFMFSVAGATSLYDHERARKLVQANVNLSLLRTGERISS